MKNEYSDISKDETVKRTQVAGNESNMMASEKCKKEVSSTKKKRSGRFPWSMWTNPKD